MTLWTWSKTAADNDDADLTVNAREGWAPSIVNNTLRALMAAAAKFRDDISGNLTTGGTGTAYTVATNQAYTSLIDGLSLNVRFHVVSGEEPTFSPDGLPAKVIAAVYGAAIPTGALGQGSVHKLTYDSTDDKWIVGGRFADVMTATGSPDLAAIEALTGTGIPRRAGSNTWANGADVTHLAATTANRLYGTDGSGNSSLITVSGLALSAAALALDVNGLSADTAPDPAADYMLTYDASASAHKKVLLGLSPGALVAIIEDNKTQGTSPNGLTANTDNVRTLNTLVYNRGSLVSLSSNRFTLPAGTWEIAWDCPIGFNNVARAHQSMLYNQTDGSVVKRGTGGAYNGGDGGDYATMISQGCAVVTITESKDFEIRHRVNGSGGSQGDDVNMGTEVFTRVIIRRA